MLTSSATHYRKYPADQLTQAPSSVTGLSLAVQFVELIETLNLLDGVVERGARDALAGTCESQVCASNLDHSLQVRQ